MFVCLHRAVSLYLSHRHNGKPIDGAGLLFVSIGSAAPLFVILITVRVPVEVYCPLRVWLGHVPPASAPPAPLLQLSVSIVSAAPLHPRHCRASRTVVYCESPRAAFCKLVDVFLRLSRTVVYCEAPRVRRRQVSFSDATPRCIADPRSFK